MRCTCSLCPESRASPPPVSVSAGAVVGGRGRGSGGEAASAVMRSRRAQRTCAADVRSGRAQRTCAADSADMHPYELVHVHAMRVQVEEESYQLKPMNCPFHVLMFQDSPRSYKSLPLRLLSPPRPPLPDRPVHTRSRFAAPRNTKAPCGARVEAPHAFTVSRDTRRGAPLAHIRCISLSSSLSRARDPRRPLSLPSSSRLPSLVIPSPFPRRPLSLPLSSPLPSLVVPSPFPRRPLSLLSRDPHQGACVKASVPFS
jgi:hypothetical protein